LNAKIIGGAAWLFVVATIVVAVVVATVVVATNTVDCYTAEQHDIRS
jgi:hypothetical protein